MRRIKLILAIVAVMVASLAMVPGPAMADDFDFEEGFFFVSDDFDFEDDDDFDFFGDGFFFVGDNDFDFFDDHDDFDFSFGGDGVSQSFEQESESGDVDQSFDVS